MTVTIEVPKVWILKNNLSGWNWFWFWIWNWKWKEVWVVEFVILDIRVPIDEK